ncbi:hypothetical protein MUK42_04726 [Musa troglodytarum]|uniref:Uncharacterized protein n=1 Tax=Musa troglodytarum TaxID=320322 RepID=A0A9E7EMF8_9LILI|nr:hypothetical protein MUK42_04726 [Musa troglodytarum]
MFLSGDSSESSRTLCTNVKAWLRPHADPSPPWPVGREAELQLLLGILGAPLVPFPVRSHKSTLIRGMREDPIEFSMAKYIVQQYIAASGGERALNAINSMYAMGKVRMMASEFPKGNGGGKRVRKCSGAVETGGFVLWQMKPDLWCLELMVSGCKISAGSDGKVAWRQTPWHQSHASRGLPRPLRRSLQVRHRTLSLPCVLLCCAAVAQRTGLLVRLEDSHLLRIKSARENVYWETTVESLMEDHRPIDGVNIAHAGRTTVSSFQFGEAREGHTRTRMEEVDFNIRGLSEDCFLPPADLKEDESGDAGGRRR